MDITEFHERVKNGELDAVKSALAGEPALLTARNASGQSSVILSKYYRQPVVTAYLLSLEPELDIYESSAVGDLAGVTRMLNVDQALLESHSTDGWTPLHLAGFFGQQELAEALIERGAAVDARSTNRMVNTPLHAAAAGGQTRLVELLLKHGADANARQQGGWTALHAAAQSGNAAMVEVLLAHAADAGARADNNQTALDLALTGAKADVAALLERFESPDSQRIN